MNNWMDKEILSLLWKHKQSNSRFVIRNFARNKMISSSWVLRDCMAVGRVRAYRDISYKESRTPLKSLITDPSNLHGTQAIFFFPFSHRKKRRFYCATRRYYSANKVVHRVLVERGTIQSGNHALPRNRRRIVPLWQGTQLLNIQIECRKRNRLDCFYSKIELQVPSRRARFVNRRK